MSEFLNYKVNLTLRDGSKADGWIVAVDSSSITLKNASQASNPGNVLDKLTFTNTELADLKVLQLPPDLVKNQNSKASGKQNGKPQNGLTEPELLDDAIVFAKSSTPSSRETLSREKGNSNKHGSSRSNTPKQKGSKSSNGNNSAVSQPDWDQEASVSDIKQSTDFDFAASLARFDKASVFADFQKADSVKPSERLVGHNKIDNVAKAKAKKNKYDNDEMVLDSNRRDNWDALGNITSAINTEYSNMSSMTPSPHLAGRELISGSKDFRFVNSTSFNVVPTCSGVQLLEIERLANDSYGISPQLMDEVCASNVTSSITTNILGGSTRLGNKNNHNFPPLVLLLIGSLRCGSRAFAIGRHLTNHGVRVLAFIISADELDPELSNQYDLFVKSGGKAITSNFAALLNIINNELETPVELIIDALQGYDDHLEDIFYQEEEQQILRNVVTWCNHPSQQNKIMSLDIPSGIDGGSGTIPNPSLKLNCRWCVSMGIPISGLIHAYKNGHLHHGEDGEIIHYLVDIGIPNSVYRSKSNLRKFDRFWYTSDSCIKLGVSTY